MRMESAPGPSCGAGHRFASAGRCGAPALAAAAGRREFDTRAFDSERLRLDRQARDGMRRKVRAARQRLARFARFGLRRVRPRSASSHTRRSPAHAPLAITRSAPPSAPPPPLPLQAQLDTAAPPGSKEGAWKWELRKKM